MGGGKRSQADRSYTFMGLRRCRPKVMGIGPAPAAGWPLKKLGTLEDIDLVEVINFAPQYKAVEKELGLDP